MRRGLDKNFKIQAGAARLVLVNKIDSQLQKIKGELYKKL